MPAESQRGDHRGAPPRNARQVQPLPTATASRQRNSAPSPARYCRRRPRSACQRQWLRSRLPCRARRRAAREARPRPAGTGRQARRRPSARRDAGYGRGRNSRSGRKVADIGPAAGEIEEIGNHRGHHRLLQHDLGQPDMIGWRQVRPAAAPGKRAAMPVIPVENLLGGKVTSDHSAETDTAQIAVQRRAIGTTREEWSHLALCDNLHAAN